MTPPLLDKPPLNVGLPPPILNPPSHIPPHTGSSNIKNNANKILSAGTINRVLYMHDDVHVLRILPFNTCKDNYNY